MDSKIKVLVCGDVNGHFKQFFSRVENVNKKSGPFEILLCVGEFFGERNDELIAFRNGFKNIPIPTYFLGPASEKTKQFYDDIENGEVCSNLTYLGKRGIYTLSSGVKIAYLSGVEGTASSDFNFTKDDVQSVRNSCIASRGFGEYRGIDILITSQWPYGIKQNAANSSKLISYLLKEIRPRYHICGLNGINFELPPFRFAKDKITEYELATRFIALADVGNSKKEKYIYALSVTSVDKMKVIDLMQKTTDEIECPLKSLDFSSFNSTETTDSSKQYFYDMDAPDNSGGLQGRKRGHNGENRPNKSVRQSFDPEKCWFCLSSEDVDKHLIISIGENFYLALAKGPINDFHVLILSVTHIQSSALLSSDDWAELTKFKKSLKDFFKSKGQVVCFTERNYKSEHLQINCIGVNAGLEWKIKHAFEDKGEEYNLLLETIPKLDDSSILPGRGPYFVAEMPDDTAFITRQMKMFPLHFAREVFCTENLLNCDEKIDWKQCSLTKDEEISLVNNFREKFKPFDFTL